jgi:hypothetical protein
VVKRRQRGAPPGPPAEPETKANWSAEHHSGEGSASALAILQTLEQRRVVPRPPADLPTADDPPTPDELPTQDEDPDR